MRSLEMSYVLILIAVLLPSQALAEKTECGTGLAYGTDHAYFLKAPDGWILDTESGAGQGIFAVFYPKGSSWDGPVVMYSNAALREGRSPDQAIQNDVKAMRENSPNLQVEDKGTLLTKDEKKSFVRYFVGDSNGNYEAAAYVVEKKIVANIILTARNKIAFESALPAFRKLVESYHFVTDDPSKLDLRALMKSETQKAKQP